MIEKNIYSIIIPVLFLSLMSFVISYELLTTAGYININSNTKTIISSGTILIGIACIAVCIFMYGVVQAKIVKNAYINCLTLFEADPAFIEKIKTLKFDIKKTGIWEKGNISYEGNKFSIAVENRLGHSKLGNKAYFLISFNDPQGADISKKSVVKKKI